MTVIDTFLKYAQLERPGIIAKVQIRLSTLFFPFKFLEKNIPTLVQRICKGRTAHIEMSQIQSSISFSKTIYFNVIAKADHRDLQQANTAHCKSFVPTWLSLAGASQLTCICLLCFVPYLSSAQAIRHFRK